ncbi:ABC transporter ATP-binding protein [Pusillimonas sp. CC-YST705]|uniref:ABC transporter ATP-binding protein n=1 Tax=Mesopusillimonas faecipullorum TaxID=2755040 RepID=A0ABS8CC30_9BURK|nr:ABC transporter ATP-binding protein [Mesopusillimonas faecipullorum]MCB5363588.1 ABC transporter ATP-binding protein [Mesopusillimonas faecipullorum]
MSKNQSATPSDPVSAPFIHLNDVSLRYGESGEGVEALKRLSLNISRGEFTAVVGPSGCGKSTLMRLLSGLTPCSSGKVCIDGKQVNQPLKTVGMAFQNSALLPWRTALENVLLPLEVVEPYRRDFRRDKARFVERARALLARVGLSGAEDLYGWELSGGMQQRVSLCRALVHEPEILLLDEPFGALDAFTREELWDILQQLWLDRGFTAMLVTHDLPEAVYLADSVHVISERPGYVVHTSHIDLPRPRTPELCFTTQFTDYVHELRTHIQRKTLAVGGAGL